MDSWKEQTLTIQQVLDLLLSVPPEKRGYPLFSESDGGQISNAIKGIEFEEGTQTASLTTG
jgi:hypothetical protein